jgi:cytoskeletal protein CcmA (bactofilin family)
MSKISFESFDARAMLSSEKISRIHHGSTIRGDIKGSDILFFNGTLVGNIKLTNKLVLGEKAIVTGNIYALHVIVLGRVEGQILIQGKAAFGKNSSFKGEISASTLEVATGAVFNATCIAGPSDKNKEELAQQLSGIAVKPEEELVLETDSDDPDNLFFGHFFKSVSQKTYSIFIL